MCTRKISVCATRSVRTTRCAVFMEWSDETHFGVEDNSNPPTKYATPSLLLLFHSHADPAKCVVSRRVVDFAAPETKLPERTLWASAEKLRSSHCAPQHLTRPSPCVPSAASKLSYVCLPSLPPPPISRQLSLQQLSQTPGEVNRIPFFP